jgi:hypothetical protein
MTTTFKFAAFALLPALLAWNCAQAAESTTIMLACDGKVTNLKTPDAKPDPVNKLGVVVNFAEHNVSFAGYVVPITSADAANVSFEGEVQSRSLGITLSVSVSGTVDRVTGAFDATTLTTVTAMQWELYCKPATRLF